MKVLSLFDGISCGQLALRIAGVDYDSYFASEVDKHCLAITQRNFPNTIHLGDVSSVNSSNLPQIDLLIGGSPCQGFSSAGKEEGFSHKGSRLFWEYIRLLKECKPVYFLLENVVMKKEWQDIISEQLGIEPILINSSLVSGQNRKRLYWTNIPIQGMPADRGIMLKDALEDADVIDWNTCQIIGRRIDANNTRKDNDLTLPLIQTLQVSNNQKSHCLSTVDKDNMLTTESPGRYQGVYDCGKYQFIPASIDTREKLLDYVGGLVNSNVQLWLKDGKVLSRNFKQGYRVYSDKGKACCLTSDGGGPGGQSGALSDKHLIRTLTPIECERLQTVPDNYTSGCSTYQRKKMLGNAWTVDVVAWILEHIK